jgi:hypothetical protein
MFLAEGGHMGTIPTVFFTTRRRERVQNTISRIEFYLITSTTYQLQPNLDLAYFANIYENNNSN